MRIVGALSWFDERPEDLYRAVTSHAQAGLLDALVAVDGRYALYPSDRVVSSREEYDAISQAAAEHRLTLTLVRHEEPWPGEVRKRTATFQHALALSRIGRDFVWVIDGDNELLAPADGDAARALLASTDRHAAEVILSEPVREWDDVRRPMRQLFRALPGLCSLGRHYYYAARDGDSWVFLSGAAERVVPALELHGLVVRHHHMDREQERRSAAYSYYAERDSRGIEQTPLWIAEGPGRIPEPVDREGELA